MYKSGTPLYKAEKILALVKNTLEDTPLWNDLKVNHSENPGPSTKLCDIALRRDKSSEFGIYFIEKSISPTRLSFFTTNRLAFAQYIPLLAKALTGQLIALDEVTLSWYWDADNPRKNGRPTHLTVYCFDIVLNTNNQFEAAAWVADDMVVVCDSLDSRADHYPFDVIEDTTGKRYCTSYQRTKTGFVLEFENIEIARTVVDKLYADCEPVFTNLRNPGRTKVTLTFPDMCDIRKAA